MTFGMAIGFAALAGWLTFDQIAQSNEMSAAVEAEFGENWREGIQGLEAIPGMSPSFQYQGRVFGPAAEEFGQIPESFLADIAGGGAGAISGYPGQFGSLEELQSGLGIFNLDELFNVGQTELDYFNQAYPTDLALPNVDIGLNAALGDISNLLGGAQEGIGAAEQAALGQSATSLAGGLSQLASSREAIGGLQAGALGNIEDIIGAAQITPEQLLAGVEMPETDLSDVLSGRLAGIGAASQTAQQLQQQELAAGGAAFGGLENLAAQGRSLAFETGAQRGLEGSFATAQTRGEELAAQQFVANLQAQAGTTSAEIASALAQAQTGAESLLTGQVIGAEGALGVAGADLEKQFGLADIDTINQAAELIAGLSEQEAQAILEAKGLELNQAELNNLIDLSNQQAKEREFAIGLGLAAGPERDELARSAMALSGWMANQGISGDIANSIMNAYLGVGSINQSMMGFSPIDYTSLLGAVEGGARGLYGDRSIEQPDQKEGYALGTAGYTCVSGRSRLWTPQGITTMRDIRIGDYVLAADGRFRRVMARDYGYVQPDYREQQLRIVLPGQSLEVTEKHPVFGRSAGQWRAGEYLPVISPRGIRPERIVRIERIPYRLSGDLYLDGNADYIVNGFVVNSVIGKIGLERWTNAVA